LTTPVAQRQAAESTDVPISLRRRLRRVWWHFAVRQITLLFGIAIAVAGWIGRRRRPIGDDGCQIMLTGRFDSDNWILAHLSPLAASKECARLWMVSTNRVPDLPKVVAVYPPKWLIRIAGVTPARLFTFMWAAMRNRPHVVGGFHLVPNGIVAVLVGRLAGASSTYFCVGGPAEVVDGGVHSEDNPFAKMGIVDPVVEKRLMSIVSKFDMIVTMGTRAVNFFQSKGVDATFHVISGGIDPQRFHAVAETPSFDLVMTGRLVPVKRMDVFLRAVTRVAQRLPNVKAVIVGDGKLRHDLCSLSRELGVDHNVTFVGQQGNVESWLGRAKIFVLTSDSEGLSLSMMEAMMCGLPVVVSNVGDLGDLVEDGVNGYLVPRRAPELFADRLAELLSDERKLKSFSQAARRAAMRYETQATIKRWDRILANL
jgi:glycosyltransferase involved in cell wall biosynthesis